MSVRGAESIVHDVRALMVATPGLCTATVDCKNAFNSMLRAAILAGIARHGFHWVRAAAHFQYGNASHAYFADAHREVHEIESTRGTKQGDSLAGFLFCTGLHSALLALQAEFPNVRFFAYMDDVTLVGNPAEVEAATRRLAELFGEVGLEIDPRKSFVYGKTPASKEFATRCGFQHSTRGVKVLGAWVSADRQGTAEFLRASLLNTRRCSTRYRNCRRTWRFRSYSFAPTRSGTLRRAPTTGPTPWKRALSSTKWSSTASAGSRAQRPIS